PHINVRTIYLQITPRTPRPSLLPYTTLFRSLLWHNENSFNYRWPLRIWFCCAKPAAEGGETPLADSRRVFEMIPPTIRERFIEKDRKSTRLSSSHQIISYAVFCLKKKTKKHN